MKATKRYDRQAIVKRLNETREQLLSRPDDDFVVSLSAVDLNGKEVPLERWRVTLEEALALHRVHHGTLLKEAEKYAQKRGNRLKEQARPKLAQAPEGAADWSTPTHSPKRKKQAP